ncbi:cobyric acid synthase [Fluviibacterium sp. DFM31]|uniref:Cobyric acid synthase n=1 Tax=Meridianimarinicoccus marinus TaxID=3231483 RepID=A0ABV3L4Y2_9RHOB
MTRAIMIQGTGSNVGKSMLVAGLARACLRRGLTVRPFKPQNMSNNAAVTEDGGEIGRAQALQARAAGVAPRVDMNPVLLKPEHDRGAQVVVQGKAIGTVRARDYAQFKPRLLQATLDSFRRLAAEADLVLIEGAGSPAEINLRAGDIANMGFAEAAGVPVVLVGDIDRGGVIAQLVGSHVILPEADRARIKACAVNKFRGDPRLFDDGLAEIVARTGWPSLGVIPWFDGAWRLPAEDILDIRSHAGDGIVVAVPRLPRIANFDDLDPLNADPRIEVRLIQPGQTLPGDADLVLIPGSKSTISDLEAFRAQGWDIDLAAHLRRGGKVLGICGGYQMLGRHIHDPEGIEGSARAMEGLGLLDVSTVMAPEKRLARVRATHSASGTALDGYEIHLGRTEGPDCARAWLDLEGRAEGARSANGQVWGCYLHGLFSADAFRQAFFDGLGLRVGAYDYEAGVEDALDDLATHLETHFDIDQMLALASPLP